MVPRSGRAGLLRVSDVRIDTGQIDTGQIDVVRISDEHVAGTRDLALNPLGQWR